ncbi:MAG TPA: valine--tRNA ligase [Steroidobacteraceae bacterium]|jgi:valyl-tRNA synthetase|nr:valine--tRNA ligase [Steroidobacteraceae bacterium]
MDSKYSPAEIEQRLYQRWEESGYFAPRPSSRHFCIVIPPPNVTGTLHMGHAFQHTIMDALTRWHRMRGDCTLWQPGLDHAGISTQMVVERQLNAQGRKRTELSRGEFVERVWAWKNESGGIISGQMRRLGASVDWSRERFTMDEGLSRGVVEAFVRLHDEGLIYRGKRLVNWDPKLLTALSDLEVLSEEEAGHLWYLRYPLADDSGHVIVATTRPETLLGDVAVAVNPQDERYRSLIGRLVRLPLAKRDIPIIADDYVDPQFGTGCLKITPAHDFNDYAIGQRHGLPLINVFTPDAKLNDQAPAHLRGLDRFEARKRIVDELQAAGLVDRIEPHKLMVPRGDRSGEVLEPYLTDQWYVRIAPLATPAIKAVESARVRFVPENYDRTFFQWMHHIQDWCISRQLWWGHRIPAWYDDQGTVYVARTEAQALQQARAKRGQDVELRQDEDVLDTWFSSGLWPFSTLGWPDSTPELRRFYPTDVLVTGFDIIFFWVARMLMFGLKFADDVPFRDVYITGLILDHEGQKMSKSKGNILDPLDVVDGIGLEALVAKRTTGLMQPHLKSRIEKTTRKEYPQGIEAYGTDSLRFTLASLATQSRDLRFDLNRVAGNRNFCNKLWNAARFVMLSSESCPAGPSSAADFSVADRWIRSRLGETIRTVERAFSEYRFDFAASALYEFTWHEFCDWYLEIAKPVLQNSADARAQASARGNLLTVLESLLRTLHPLMPFITEEIWMRVAPMAGVGGPSIMLSPWPKADEFAPDPDADEEMHWVMQVVLGIRQIRGVLDIPASRKLPLLLHNASARDLQWLAKHRVLLMRLAGLESMQPLAHAEAAPPAAAELVGELVLLVPMAGLIDPASELERLEKRLARVEAELKSFRGKLANENFVRNAPPEVVAQEHERVSDRERARAGLIRQIEQVRKLLN